MKTYLSELYYQTDENKSINKKNLTSNKKEKNIINTKNKKPKTDNKISRGKSSLFLNNFFRNNINSLNNTDINSKKNYKKRKKKKINITPYQRMGNEYILNYALDNLNKYQENLLIKENEDEKNNINNELSGKINYYNENDKKNKTSKNFRSSYKNIKRDENIFNKFYNNKNYSEYFLRNDLFNEKKEIKNEFKKSNEEIPEPEPYIINKYATKNNDINNNNDKLNKNINIDIKLNFTLSNLELNELKNVFKNNYIFFEDLFLLTKEDFVEMNIPIGPRNRLLNFIKKYKNYAKNFDLNELSSFMNKYKESINSIEVNNTLGETPSTNNKYKSTMTTETNKNKGDSKEKRLNISNLEEGDSLLKHKIKKKNNIKDDLNEIINNNYIDENNNKRFNTYKTIETKDNNENDFDNNLNSNDINKNFFSNSLFKEFTSNTTELNDVNIDINDLNQNKKNSLKNTYMNNLISKNTSPFITNNNIVPVIINKNNNKQNINNKKNKGQSTYYKNYQNIFLEIEKYQTNYEKMKKENKDRNIKINYLLEKKNKANIQYLKLKLKNSKYYNDEDLKNESVRDLDKELQKMNFNQENNSQNFIKKKKEIKNPLIEEFNKHK